MFAFAPVAALLALSSSVVVVHAQADNEQRSLSGMEGFKFNLAVNFDDPDSDKLTDADKAAFESCVVTSFNSVHDTSVIELESFAFTVFNGKGSSNLSSKYLGGYNYGGGHGNNCRMCANDDMLESTSLAATHEHWQTALNECLNEKGGELAKVHNVVIEADSGSLLGAADTDVAKDGMEEFEFNLEINYDDPDADKLTDADKTAFEACVVSSFNSVHDTSVIELETFSFTQFNGHSSSNLSKYLGGYTYGGGHGNNCRMCANDDMMLSAEMIKSSHAHWQTALNDCLTKQGGELAKIHNVAITVDGDTSGSLHDVSQHDMKEEFDVKIAIAFHDPDASLATDLDKEIFSDCVVTSFNKVHDTNVIELTKFELTEWTPSTSVFSLLRGSNLGGGYTYGGGHGNNCRMCANDDMMLATPEDMLKASHDHWSHELKKCLEYSGSSSLKAVSNVKITVDTDVMEASA